MATQDTIPLTFQAYHRLDASRVRRAWQRSSPHEMAQGALLTQTGMQLIERLEEIRLVPERILDLGDRTGQMGRQLQKRWPKAHIVSLTFAEKLAQNSRYRAFPWQRRPWNMVGEATHLPFGRDTFDLVLSNMALHWTTNLPNTLQEIRRVLAPDRLLLFTVAGEETLWELHTCLAQLDQEQYGHIKKRGQELPSLETLGDLDYDAVIIPEGGDRLRSVALLLPYYDIDPSKIRFIGTGLWDDETIGREPALVGGWFAAVPPALSNTFANRYAEVYNARPPRVASIAYDAVALAALLAVEISYRGEARFGAGKLTAVTGFSGANGLFRLNANGLTERGLAVVEVRRDGTRVIDPPSDTFPPPPPAPSPAAVNDPALDPYGWQTTESGWPAP